MAIDPRDSLSIPKDVQLAEAEQFDDSVTLIDLFELCYRRRWWILSTLCVVFALGCVYTFSRPKVYQASTSVLFCSSENSVKSDDVPVLAELQALTQSRSVDTMVQLLSSRDLLEEAYSTFPEAYRLRHFGAVGPSDGLVTVTAEKNTDVIWIYVKAYSREAAVELAKRTVATFFARDVENNRSATRQARIYVEENISNIKAQLDRVNRSLAQRKRQYGLIAPENQLSFTAQHVVALRAELDTQQTEYQAEKERNSQLYRQLAQENPKITSSTVLSQNPQFLELQKQLDALFSERILVLQTYTPSSKQALAIDARIEDTKQRMVGVAAQIVTSTSQGQNPVYDELKRQYTASAAQVAALGARIHALTSAIGRQEAQTAALPDQERQITELMQQQELYRGTYELLTQKLHTLLMSEKSTMPNARIIDTPRAAQAPISPRTTRNLLLFFLCGVAAAALVVILVEHIDDRIHSQEMTEKLSGLATIAQIPELAPDEPHLIHELSQSSIFAESFRILRNNISFMGIDRSLQCLAISSAGASEGKTSTVVNLGIAFALEGKRVIIVDCDLHRPTQHKVLGLSARTGFTNVVTGTASLEDTICTTAIAGLSLLPAGPLPPNPSEVLGSQRSRQVLDTLKQQYDVVLLDCPPCIKMSDVQVIAMQVDALLLVVAMDRTPASAFRYTVNALALVQAPLAGIVSNFVDTKRRGPGAYPYKNYYYSYSAYREGKRSASHRSKRHLQRAMESTETDSAATGSKTHD